MNHLRRLALFLLVAASVPACSDKAPEEERRYAIPDGLCDTEVARHLLDPLFPAGERLEVVNYYEDPRAGRLNPSGKCLIEVDGTGAIYVESDPAAAALSEAPGVAPYLSTYLDGTGNLGTYDTSDGKRVAEPPRETWVWPDLAATSILCESSSSGFSAINISIRLDWTEDDDDYSKPLKGAIGPFASALMKRIGERTCAPA